MILLRRTSALLYRPKPSSFRRPTSFRCSPTAPDDFYNQKIGDAVALWSKQQCDDMNAIVRLLQDIDSNFAADAALRSLLVAALVVFMLYSLVQGSSKN